MRSQMALRALAGVIQKSATCCLATALLLAIVTPAKGNTIYQYTGSPFTDFSGGLTNPPYTNLSGTFELAAALPANMPLADITSSLLSLDFTDGVDTLSLPSLAIPPSSIELATDASGQIVLWLIGLQTPGSQTIFLSQSDPTLNPYYPIFNAYDVAGINQGQSFAQSHSIGTWTVVPEPSTGALLTLGLAGVAVRRRPVRASSSP